MPNATSQELKMFAICIIFVRAVSSIGNVRVLKNILVRSKKSWVCKIVMNFVFTFGSYSQYLHRLLLNHCGSCNCSWCAWWHCRLFEPCSICGYSSPQREQLRIEVGILATARPGGPAKRWIAASGHAPICWTEQQKQHCKEYIFKHS